MHFNVLIPIWDCSWLGDSYNLIVAFVAGDIEKFSFWGEEESGVYLSVSGDAIAKLPTHKVLKSFDRHFRKFGSEKTEKNTS